MQLTPREKALLRKQREEAKKASVTPQVIENQLPVKKASTSQSVLVGPSPNVKKPLTSQSALVGPLPTIKKVENSLPIYKKPFDTPIKITPGQYSLFNDHSRKCTKKALKQYYSIYSVVCKKAPHVFYPHQLVTTHSFYLFISEKVSEETIKECESSFNRNRNAIKESIQECIQPVIPEELFKDVFGINEWHDREFYVVPSNAPRDFELSMNIDRRDDRTSISIDVVVTLCVLTKEGFEEYQELIGQSLKTERLWDSWDNLAGKSYVTYSKPVIKKPKRELSLIEIYEQAMSPWKYDWDSVVEPKSNKNTDRECIAIDSSSEYGVN